MKRILAALLVASSMPCVAQTQNDPVLMTIHGVSVPRSEFEYSFNKNNAEGVIDKKTVDEYVDLFVNYKLKVIAAREAHLDTLPSFKREYAQYRDQQIRPTLINDNDVEDAIRFKTKKIRQFNSDELADTMKNAVKRSSNLMMIDKDTGDIIFNS